VSTSAPETTAEETDDPGALSGDQARFIAEILGANARWSAGIHNAALDGQERASNEWAGRYLQLVQALDYLMADAAKWDRETDLFADLGDILSDQGYLPGSARSQLEHYQETLEKRKAEAEAELG